MGRKPAPTNISENKFPRKFSNLPYGKAFLKKLPKAIFFQRYREVRSPKNIVLNLNYQRCSELSQILNGQQRKGEGWRLKGADHLKATANFIALVHFYKCNTKRLYTTKRVSASR
jgi:hypothetical protein